METHANVARKDRERTVCRLRLALEEGKRKNFALFRMWIAVHAPMITLTVSSLTNVQFSHRASTLHNRGNALEANGRPASTRMHRYCSRSADIFHLRYIMHFLDTIIMQPSQEYKLCVILRSYNNKRKKYMK